MGALLGACSCEWGPDFLAQLHCSSVSRYATLVATLQPELAASQRLSHAADPIGKYSASCIPVVTDCLTLSMPGP
jgi:hypothetical protein